MAEAEKQVRQPRLESPRLILEPYQESDLEDIFVYAKDPQVARFVPWQSHQSVQDSLAFFDYVKKQTSTASGRLFYVFALRLRSTGRVIGSFDFKNTHARAAQIDYAIGVKHWNQGLTSEAAQCVCEWAWRTLPELVRIQAFCHVDNTGSFRVMEKIGMQREGLRRKAFLLKGEPIDVYDYSMVR